MPPEMITIVAPIAMIAKKLASVAVWMSVYEFQKLLTVTPVVRRLRELGFRILATAGTARYLGQRGIPADVVLKVYEGRPNVVDLVVSGQVQLLINTPLGKLTQVDDYTLRQAALQHRVPYTTTMSAAHAACDAITELKTRAGEVKSLQEWHTLARSLATADSG